MAGHRYKLTDCRLNGAQREGCSGENEGETYMLIVGKRIAPASSRSWQGRGRSV